MTDSREVREHDFEATRSWLVHHPVPPSPGASWDEWRAAAADLGNEHIPGFLELLAIGDAAEQYGSLLALRELGVEAWATGNEATLTYSVRLPGADAITVLPRLVGETSRSEDELEQTVADALVGERETDFDLPLGLEELPVWHRVREATRSWRNIYVAARSEDRLTQGFIDILYESDEALHFVEVKTSSRFAQPDEDIRMYYGTYASAVSEVLRQRVADATFVWVTPDGFSELVVGLEDMETAPVTQAVLKLAG